MPNKFRTVLHAVVGGACIIGAFMAGQLGLMALMGLLSIVGILNLAVVVYDIKEHTSGGHYWVEDGADMSLPLSYHYKCSNCGQDQDKSDDVCPNQKEMK